MRGGRFVWRAGMRALFTAIGTRGDIQLMLAPARELHRRGHQVVVGAPENFRAWVEAAGLSFVPVIRSLAPEMAGSNAPERILFAMRDEALDVLDRTIAAAEGSSLVVATGPHSAAFSAAERNSATYAYVACSPVYVRSREHAPLGSVTWPFRAANQVHWHAQEALYQLIFGRAANDARRKRGLAPVRSLLHEQVSAGRLVFAFDAEMDPLPEDLVGRGIMTGPLAYSGDDELPEAITNFLEAGPPPLYVGFGSMNDLSSSRLVELGERLALEHDVRVIVPTGETSVLSPRLVTLGNVSHAQLFPRLEAAVHHGGSGTVYSAARAGIPQAVVAHHGDQGWYGRRVATLGLGPASLALKRLDERSLSRMIGTLLDHPQYAQNAAAYATRLRRHGGAAAAADAFEAMATSAG